MPARTVKIYFDTSVLIAAVLEKHPYHDPAFAALQRARKKEIQGSISGPGLAEFYAVLTRLPLTPAVSPYQIQQMLETNLVPHFEVVPLAQDEYYKAVRDCAAAGCGRSRIYEALHLAAARKVHCQQVYTYNLQHFRELGPDFGDRIRTP